MNHEHKYYHKSFGQTAFTSVPRSIKDVNTYLELKKTPKIEKLINQLKIRKLQNHNFVDLDLNLDQKNAVKKIFNSIKPSLLHGVTGSGKTRVYAKLIQETLIKNPNSQILLLVPEIGLTPQV